MSKTSDSSDESEGWEEMLEDGVDKCPLLCLLCTTFSETTEDFLKHLRSHNNWDDLWTAGDCPIKEQYDWIRFVNLVRSKRPVTWKEILTDEKWITGSDDLLLPAIPDDPVLAIDIEAILEELSGTKENVQRQQTDVNNSERYSGGQVDIVAENQFLREQLATCRRLLSTLAGTNVLEIGETCTHPPIVKTRMSDSVFNSYPGESPYFTSYGHFSIHAEMINDVVRTKSYRDFMLLNASTHFVGKRVLDVGCGSGILSLFAAEAGANHVYGVEASIDIYTAAQETVIANHLSDRITLLHSCAENVTLPVKEVDVVISEWMGYFLLFESMLDSVVQISLRYLTPNGHVFPRHYTLRLLGVSCGEKLRHDYLDLWNNVYGYEMPALHRAAVTEAHILDLTNAHVLESSDAVHRFRILTKKPCDLYQLDLDEVLKQRRNQAASEWTDLQFAEGPIDLWIDCDASTLSSKSYQLDAFVGYFDVQFDKDAPNQVAFSTSPMAQSTHWKQTVFFLDKPIFVELDDHVTGSFKIRRAMKDVRGLEVSLQVDSLHGQPAVEQLFTMTN